MLDRDTYSTQKGDLVITPVHHATLVMEWDETVICCDPIGGAARFAYFPKPNLVILTHHHPDHLDLETLEAVLGPDTRIIAPRVVEDELPQELRERTEVLANGEETRFAELGIKAIPMYNTTPERQKFHEKGVGNGYLFDFAGTRVYLASDTEPTPEMDDLGEIEIAFFPMNLPYTMTPDQVVTCIHKTRPKFVYPFHMRAAGGDNDFEPSDLVAAMPADSGTTVVSRDWYRES